METSWHRPVTEWASFIGHELSSSRHSESVAFRALIGLSDDLRAASPLLRAYLCESPPALCGDPRFDAALAALAEHWLVEAQLPVPTWVSEPSRTLEEERAVSPYTDVADVPSAFRRHGVLLAASELESV
jgi:hypothetical protein